MAKMKRTSSSGDEGSSDRQERDDEFAQLKKRTREKEGTMVVGCYQRQIRRMLKDDVKATGAFLNMHPEQSLGDEIDDFGNTIFHVIVQKQDTTATIPFLKDLVRTVSAETLKKNNVVGLTALHIAACAGNTKALQVFATKDPSLLRVKDQSQDEWLPIHHAARWCRKETVEYLLPQTDLTGPVTFDAVLLLYLLVDSTLPGLALKLLNQLPHLATLHNNPFWLDILNKLAEKSLAYTSGRKLGYLESLIYSNIPVIDDDQDHFVRHPWDDDLEMQNILSTNHSKEIRILSQIVARIGTLKQKLYAPLWNILIRLVPYIKRISDQKHMHLQTLELVRRMISNEFWTYNKAIEKLKEPVLKAARLGIDEFVNEVLKAYPDSALFSDAKGRNMFLLAVLHRKENVFNLIQDQVASIKDLPSNIRDKSGDNILHLAGKMLLLPTEVPGAALQMQRELQWFTGIRHFFHPSLQEQQNGKGFTPGALFTKEHENLMEKGERWMRDTATTCLAEAAAIIAIVFAAAFTVPGEFNPSGVPVYLSKTSFRIFAVSVAVALFASITAVQMFLGMLMSRYAEDDFLKTLPKKLIIGLAALFLSIICTMVAFGAAFCIVFSHQWKWVIILMGLGCLPLTLFAGMQLRLLVDIFISTYGPDIFKLKKYV